MTLPEWLARFQPGDAIAALAILSTVVLTLGLQHLKDRARRNDELVDMRRVAHLRFWAAANAWLRNLQQVRAGEEVRPGNDNVFEHQKETHAALREIEIISPAVFARCSRVSTALDLAQSDLSAADEAGVVKPGRVDPGAAETGVADSDLEAARVGLNQLLEALRSFNERRVTAE